jgi:uncharacterized protein YegP (UPF0339 family)
MGKFEVYQSDKDNKYYFNLKAGNGQVILTSQGYSGKSGCENGIDSVRENCSDDDCVERKEAKNGKWHFNLKAKNGQVIGRSQLYKDDSGMENGIESVRKNAPDSEVDYL